MRLKPIGIQKRTVAATLGTALIAFIIFGLGLVSYQANQIKPRVQQSMESSASLIAASTAVAIEFGDPDRIQEMLGSLQLTNAQILRADIIRSDGPLATYPTNNPPLQLSVWTRTNEFRLNSDNAELVKTLSTSDPGRPVRLFLRMSLEEAKRNQRKTLAEISLAGGLIVFVVALMQFVLLQRWVLSPLAQLAAIAETAGRQGDYSQRMPAHNRDEFGQLGNRFNALLAAVQQREAALRRLTNFQRAILDDAAYSIISTDTTGCITSINPAGEKLTGWKSEELVGKAGSTIFHLAAEVAARAHQLSAKLGETIPADREALVAEARRGLRSESEWNYVRKDGSHIPVLLSVTALRDDHGEIFGFLGIAVDITARKLAEEQIHLHFSAMSAAANAIVITGRNGTIEWVNPSFTKLTGYSPNEAIGSSFRILKSGHHDGEFYRQLWTTILDGKVWHGELINKHKDGRFYTEDMTITPVLSQNGEITHFIAIQQDVTERKLLEKKLQQAQKMESIGTLAGGIAHDFNNILAAMVGYCELLQQDTAGNPAAQEDAAEILKAASRAKDLVQQILTFSRQGEQTRQDIQLQPVVKEATKFLRASLPAQIKIELNLAVGAPAVLADPTQIYQVTMNLATNALHAMEGRPGRLTVNLDSFLPDREFIRTHPEFQPVEYARLSVADTGHGMDAKTLERIFEPFFTTKPAGKGTGLGLAVVHGIVQSHAGLITVESHLGRGTTFCLHFPARPRNGIRTDGVTDSVPYGRGQMVLLVDDEKTLTAMFQKMLSRLNYRVTTTNHAREAIQLFHDNAERFDLVISDLTMPEFSGLEVARQLHRIRPDVPVILASGYAASLNKDALREAGICELLYKPVTLPALATAVHRAFAKT
jgi:PAS domain S-box-containing protein